MNIREELGSKLQPKVGETNIDSAITLFLQICDEDKFRKEKPLLRRILHRTPDYWGPSLLCPALEEAGFIEMPQDVSWLWKSVYSYVPTKLGLEYYRKLQEEQSTKEEQSTIH